MSKYNSKCPLNCNKKGCGILLCQRYADYQKGRADVITELLETQKHDELSQKIAIDVLNRGIAKGKKDGAREFAKFLIDKGIDVVDLSAEFQRREINNI